jgi:hypothetical protein
MAQHHPSAATRHRLTFAERADAILDAAPDGRLAFEKLAAEMYPDPKSWRYQSNGGPPGCYMALSAGLRRGGFYVGPWPDRIVNQRPKDAR